MNIIANLVAFVAFIAFLNGVLGYCGGLLGNPDINLEWIFGKIFIPLCWLMGEVHEIKRTSHILMVLCVLE